LLFFFFFFFCNNFFLFRFFRYFQKKKYHQSNRKNKRNMQKRLSIVASIVCLFISIASFTLLVGPSDLLLSTRQKLDRMGWHVKEWGTPVARVSNATLYVGSVMSAQALGALRAECITHILSMVDFHRLAAGHGLIERNAKSTTTRQRVDREQQFVAPLAFNESLSLTLLWLDTEDNRRFNISAHFDRAYRFIDEALGSGHSALVHCQMGQSRSGTIAIAYLVRKRCMSPAEALSFVRAARSQIRPKKQFMRALDEYYRQCCPAIGNAR
jgi:predicted protein tyrosine phosphatase/uncharacterized membrane protein